MAAIRKGTNGRWTAVLKSGRQYVASKTFDTRREAAAWATAEEVRLRAGIDPRAGKVRVGDQLDHWLDERAATVAPKTATADRDLARLLPRWFTALEVRSINQAHVERLLADWSRGRGHASVVRLRASLSAFFNACVRGRLIAGSPVAGVPVPRRIEPLVEMRPFTEVEVESLVHAIRQRQVQLADVVLVAAWTGLRWGELRALRVADLVEVPSPALVVRRSHSEGQAVKGTKSARSRRVPVTDRVLRILRGMATGKGPDDLLLTTSRGAQLHVGAFKRATAWDEVAGGRRIHDLRHTAACLWLARGVDLKTVQAWLGHADVSTTNRYLHYLGTSADRAGLDLLNAPGANAGQVASGADAMGDGRHGA